MKQFRELSLTLVQILIATIALLFIEKGKPNFNFDISLLDSINEIKNDNYKLSGVIIFIVGFYAIHLLKNYIRNRSISKEIISSILQNKNHQNIKSANIIVKKHSHMLKEANFGEVTEEGLNIVDKKNDTM